MTTCFRKKKQNNDRVQWFIEMIIKRRGETLDHSWKKWTSQLQIKYAVDFRMFTSREGKWRWKNLYPYWSEMVWPVVHWSYPKRIMGWFFFLFLCFFLIELILISYTIHVKFICSKQTLICACMYWFRFTYKNSECRTLAFSFCDY
jgi:hypothetical protein